MFQTVEAICNRNVWSPNFRVNKLRKSQQQNSTARGLPSVGNSLTRTERQNDHRYLKWEIFGNNSPKQFRCYFISPQTPWWVKKREFSNNFLVFNFVWTLYFELFHKAARSSHLGDETGFPNDTVNASGSCSKVLLEYAQRWAAYYCDSKISKVQKANFAWLL